MCHNAIVGHNGVDRTFTRLFSLQQVEKNMKQHVRTFIQNCPCCQKLSAKDPNINASHFATLNYAIFDTLNVDYILTKVISLSLSIPIHDGQNCSAVQTQMLNQQLTVCLHILVDSVHQI